MREISDFEMRNMYGGFLATITAVATIAIMAIAAYKMLSAESAKIKLPDGTDISFKASGSSKNTKNIKISSAATTKVRAKIKTKEHTLKQLDNLNQSYSSTPSNFLVKL